MATPAILPAAAQARRDTTIGALHLHYRAWFALVRQSGYEVAGKDPLAVFLTQLSRSPAVRKSTQAGIYELDPTSRGRLRRQLDILHEELRGLASTPSDTADLAAVRARRAQLAAQISQAEKAVEELDVVLGLSREADRLAEGG